MLWWAENDFAVKPQLVVIVSALVHPLIPHGGGLLVAQHILWRKFFPPRYSLCTFRTRIYIAESRAFHFDASYFIRMYHVFDRT